jgi:hypothetical protein
MSSKIFERNLKRWPGPPESKRNKTPPSLIYSVEDRVNRSTKQEI